MPVLDISIVPVGTGQPSFSSYVAEACRLIEQHGLKYQITPTGTVIEGNLDQLMNVARQIHSIPFQMGAERVITSMTIDERHDRPMDMERQVQSVKRNMSQ
ncbi:MTH1187 family thiamine-binding protein [Caldicoprobacter algeriensis]|uniref:MTH1187 family thiamine-binding protein n=1 Tax=Caldicoprobacter algeriensis TaxID=699281 RepID=UPI0020799EB7|nr:MTH1187 family thiamine-binding protein [Caldicoprobacter algeriensis]MCM8901134.1 MTH1187 family thiamine-binding protein [Caldicoprobacter algeriensis]